MHIIIYQWQPVTATQVSHKILCNVCWWVRGRAVIVIWYMATVCGRQDLLWWIVTVSYSPHTSKVLADILFLSLPDWHVCLASSSWHDYNGNTSHSLGLEAIFRLVIPGVEPTYNCPAPAWPGLVVGRGQRWQAAGCRARISLIKVSLCETGPDSEVTVQLVAGLVLPPWQCGLVCLSSWSLIDFGRSLGGMTSQIYPSCLLSDCTFY